MKRIYPYAALIVIQLLLLLLAFPRFFLHPGDFMFSVLGDGVKNYFTLLSYVKEPVSAGGFFKYNSFAYPFGDYVFYTDNTPFFAIPFKWFCVHICDFSDYAIPAFNGFILSGIIISSLLTYSIFRSLFGRNLMAGAVAVLLPWINIQLPRIWNGHYNLSLSWVVLLMLALFLMWFRYKGSLKRQITVGACMVVFLSLSFFIHGYYIAILGAFVAGLLLFAGLFSLRKPGGKASLIAAFVVPALSLAISLGLVLLCDGYYALRKESAMGYDHADMKTNFSLLFTHYDFQTFAFPIASTLTTSIETSVYLGNLGLLTISVLWLGCLLSTPFREQVMGIQAQFFAHPLMKTIFFGGLVSLVISFGEWYSTNREPLAVFTPFTAANKLGSAVLIAWAVGIGSALYIAYLILSSTARSQLLTILLDWRQRPLRKVTVLLVAGAIVYLLVGQYAAEIPNLVNPLFYLHMATRKVEQFRSLSRFCWPFFWTLYIWVFYTIIHLLRQYPGRVGIAITILAVAIGALELGDYVRKLRKDANHSNLFAESQLQPMRKLGIDYAKYQAILPLPYYIVGSEDYPHTIDDNNDWSIFTMQLSLATKLPLMACKLSRTPPAFSIALLDFVANDSLQPMLRERLNAKPILIVLDRNLLNDPHQIDICASTDRALSREYYAKTIQFVARHHLQPMDSLGGKLFYSWTPVTAAPGT